jgi:hypothetical protein
LELLGNDEPKQKCIHGHVLKICIQEFLCSSNGGSWNCIGFCAATFVVRPSGLQCEQVVDTGRSMPNWSTILQSRGHQVGSIGNDTTGLVPPELKCSSQIGLASTCIYNLKLALSVMIVML